MKRCKHCGGNKIVESDTGIFDGFTCLDCEHMWNDAYEKYIDKYGEYESWTQKQRKNFDNYLKRQEEAMKYRNSCKIKLTKEYLKT